MKGVLTLILALAIAGGGWFLWQKRQPSSASTSAIATPALSANIETRNIRFSVSAAGEITPAEQVSVRPEVNGRVDVLPVDVGDEVKKDQLLFKLDDRELQTQKQQEDKNVIRARLELDQAQRDHERAKRLIEGKLISQELFEDARTKFELARNDLDRAEKSMELILERLRKTEVKAPFDCTVLTRPISIGQAVSGSGGFNSGTEILTIANLDDLIINAHINQADVSRLRIDQEVEVTVEAVPGLKVIGKVERLAPQATIKNGIKGFAARILLKSVDKRVRPGMTANILIPVASAEGVVAAPLASVFTEINQETKRIERYAFVQNGEEWERRPIELGVSDYFFVEVTKGLKPGDVVALEDKDKGKAAKPGALAAAGMGRPGPAGASAGRGGAPAGAGPGQASGAGARPATTR